MSRSSRRKEPRRNWPVRKPPEAPGHEKPPMTQRAPLPSVLPWVGALTISVAIIDSILPNNWIYAWTQERQPAWAKAVFFWAVVAAAVMFIHAYVAAQLRTTMDDANESDHRATKEIYRITGSFASAGAFFGVLMTVTAGPLPESIKQTSLASDLVMVGTVIGMALASPILAVYTWRAVKRIRQRGMSTYLRYGFLLAVVDNYIAYKIFGWV
jgi:hypothetical protein